MKLLFLALCAAAVGSAGTITSGTFNNGPSTCVGSCTSLYASLSGDHFSAIVYDDEFFTGEYIGAPPFALPFSIFFWAANSNPSGVVYDGVSYLHYFSIPPPGANYSTETAQVTRIGSAPIITGPGTYHFPLFITLSFSLYDAAHQLILSETDTGYAEGTANFFGETDPSAGNALFGGNISGQVVAAPEPANWSLALLGLLGLAARKWLPAL